MQAKWKNVASRTDRLELPNGYLYRYKNENSVAMCFVPAWTPSEELIFYTNSGNKTDQESKPMMDESEILEEATARAKELTEEGHPCGRCGGSGFDGHGSGYGDVCGECGGLRYFP